MDCTTITPKTRRASVVRVQMVKERTIMYPAVGGPSDLVAAVRALVGEMDRECFVVAHLSAKHAVLSLEITAIGCLTAVPVHPREVFKSALLSNASVIALAHLHPSGDPTPSPEDLAVTRQLMDAGELLGIRILDHVVLGEDCHISIRERSQLWNERPFHA